MEYHRPQLKQSAKIAMSQTRPKAWLVTLLFLLIGMIVTGLFSFLSPEPFEQLNEPLSEALEAAVDRISGTGDIDQAIQEFQFALEDEFRERLGEYIGGGLLARPDADPVTGFLLHLLAGTILTGLAAWLMSLIASLINVVFDHGYRAYCLGVFRRQDPSVGKLFSAFPRILTVIGSYIMVNIFTFLWTLLGIAAGGTLIFLVVFLLPETAALILSMIIYLGMLAFILSFVLRYALVPYLVVEQRDLGVFDAIRESKRLMQGNKLRLFALELSFMGWGLLIVFIIVGVLTVGILIGALVISVTRMVMLGAAVIGVAAIAAVVVTFPLSLWLTTYQSVSFAGFYHIVSFPEEEPAWEETTLTAPAAAMGAPVWLNAPEEELLPDAEETEEISEAEESDAGEPDEEESADE